MFDLLGGPHYECRKLDLQPQGSDSKLEFRLDATNFVLSLMYGIRSVLINLTFVRTKDKLSYVIGLCHNEQNVGYNTSYIMCIMS